MAKGDKEWFSGIRLGSAQELEAGDKGSRTWPARLTFLEQLTSCGSTIPFSPAHLLASQGRQRRHGRFLSQDPITEGALGGLEQAGRLPGGGGTYLSI